MAFINHREMGDKSEVSPSTACEKVNGVGTDKNLFRLVPPSTTCTSGASARAQARCPSITSGASAHAQALSLDTGTKSEKGYHFWAEPPCIVHYRECRAPHPPPPSRGLYIPKLNARKVYLCINCYSSYHSALSKWAGSCPFC